MLTSPTISLNIVGPTLNSATSISGAPDAYMAFFEHLDSTGGFYYERWVSLALLLSIRGVQLTFGRSLG